MAATMVADTGESQAQTRGRQMKTTSVKRQRSAGTRVPTRSPLTRRRIQSRNNQSFQPRVSKGPIARKPVARKPVTNMTVRPKPAVNLSRPRNGSGAIRPRPIFRPGSGSVKPLPRPDDQFKPSPRPIDRVSEEERPRHDRHWFKSGRRARFVGHWCFDQPIHCHWWFDYCIPLAYCDIAQIVACNFFHCTVPEVILPGGEIVNDAIWYLGLKGMVLPESGLGIDEVDPDSPAVQAGLEAGMVIISCNEIEITEEADMQRAIESSGGILAMIVQLEDGSQGEAVIQMVRAPAVNN